MPQARALVTAALIAAVSLGATRLGQVHIVHGSHTRWALVDKVSWSLEETLVNVDALERLPAIVARARYPLFLAALERDRDAADIPGAPTWRNATRIGYGMGPADVERLVGAPAHRGEEVDGEARHTWFDPLNGKTLRVLYRAGLVAEIQLPPEHP